jgi:hypothetical protein
MLTLRAKEQTVSNLREAAELALEALSAIQVDVKTTPNAYEAQRQAVAALRAALAEPVEVDNKDRDADEFDMIGGWS